MKSDASLRLGDYEVHRAREGFSSIRQVSSGEIMHSRTAPMEEARKLYVEQSHLAERLRDRTAPGEPLVIWDVGLGAGANAMAAVECYEEEAAGTRSLTVVSFENDLDSLRLALAHEARFPYLRAEAARALLAEGEWQSPAFPGLRWLLLAGDFLETLSRAPVPDLIFYDMFSSKTSAALWTLPAFQRIFEACRGRAAEFFTYTCSTANRARLLAAGFYVARGRNAGEKVETTIALTPAAFHGPFGKGREMLSADWLEKWNRSAAKFPNEIGLEERSLFEKLISGHEQFRKSARPERLL